MTADLGQARLVLAVFLHYLQIGNSHPESGCQLVSAGMVLLGSVYLFSFSRMRVADMVGSGGQENMQKCENLPESHVHIYTTWLTSHSLGKSKLQNHSKYKKVKKLTPSLDKKSCKELWQFLPQTIYSGRIMCPPPTSQRKIQLL